MTDNTPATDEIEAAIEAHDKILDELAMRHINGEDFLISDVKRQAFTAALTAATRIRAETAKNSGEVEQLAIKINEAAKKWRTKKLDLPKFLENGVFVNTGTNLDDPDLLCPCCGGSGHKDDCTATPTNSPAKNSGEPVGWVSQREHEHLRKGNVASIGPKSYERVIPVYATTANSRAEDAWTVSGPYQYDGDIHPSFRIDAQDRIIATVFAADGDIEKARAIAECIASLPISTNTEAVHTLITDLKCGRDAKNTTPRAKAVFEKHIETVLALATPVNSRAEAIGMDASTMTQIVEMGGGAIMRIVDPRSFADGGVEWKLRYATDLEPVRMLAASLIASYDYLISDGINKAEAVRRLCILREARSVLLQQEERS